MEQIGLYPNLQTIKPMPPKRPPQPDPKKVKHIVEERRKCSEEQRIKILQQNQAVIIDELKKIYSILQNLSKMRNVLKTIYAILQGLQNTRAVPSAPPEIKHEDHCCLCTQ